MPRSRIWTPRTGSEGRSFVWNLIRPTDDRLVQDQTSNGDEGLLGARAEESRRGPEGDSGGAGPRGCPHGRKRARRPPSLGSQCLLVNRLTLHRAACVSTTMRTGGSPGAPDGRAHRPRSGQQRGNRSAATQGGPGPRSQGRLLLEGNQWTGSLAGRVASSCWSFSGSTGLVR
jgi:hypothetical protein